MLEKTDDQCVQMMSLLNGRSGRSLPFLFVILGVVLMFLPHVAHGANASSVVTIEEIRSMTGGYYKVGRWHPIEVSLRSSVAFTGFLSIQAGMVHTRLELTILPGETRHVIIPLVCWKSIEGFDVQVTDGKQTVARKSFTQELFRIPEDEPIVGYLGSPAFFSAFRSRGLFDETSIHLIQLDRSVLTYSPNVFLDAVDVVLYASDMAFQQKHFAQWMLRGGRLIREDDASVLTQEAFRLFALPAYEPKGARVVASSSSSWFRPRQRRGLIGGLLYFFVMMLVLANMAKRKIRLKIVMIVLTSLAFFFSVGLWWVMNQGNISVEISDIVMAHEDDRGQCRLYVICSDRTQTYTMKFDHLVKPVFVRSSDVAPMLMTITASGHCEVKDYFIPRGTSVCLSGYDVLRLPQLDLEYMDGEQEGEGMIVNRGVMDVDEAYLVDDQVWPLDSLVAQAQRMRPLRSVDVCRNAVLQFVWSRRGLPGRSIIGRIPPPKRFLSGMISDDIIEIMYGNRWCWFQLASGGVPE